MELELPHPDVLWTRLDGMAGDYANLATVYRDSARVREQTNTTSVANRDRWTVDDGAGNWFTLIRLPDGLAMLFGWDESSDVRAHSDDPWTGTPRWVQTADKTVDNPRIINKELVSFVRWWDGRRWQRVQKDPMPDDGLYMALRELADPWFPADEPAMDHAAAVAAARGFEPSESQMQYRKLTDPAAGLIDPVQTFIEIDSDGYESRKVEYFRSGGVGYAGGFTESATTQLCDQEPADPIERLANRTGLVAEEISPEEFQVAWLIASGAE
ncbi:DUF6881 domain-containing protein [Nocardia sp. NPDC052566]|uniref:DUF6881 domain-containing protein n=1 Tax=Nocardia sp. NPDC052566 TaxID=3364330 RepID=UPI0037C6A342